MNTVTWFEIPVLDMDRAKSFYEKSFDITIDIHEIGPALMGWFPGDTNSDGATGTLLKGDTYVPSHEGTLVYLSVLDIDATLEKINSHGGKTMRPKMSIGEHGFIGVFEDCEGNRVALHSRA
ncbi:MAG: VOC family protein [Reichenbachiella sp.]|uniref:VOC family protein n=1 Tax=Reichenbachiella sp. TaxID=2184521 RepID=UPI0032639665